MNEKIKWVLSAAICVLFVISALSSAVNVSAEKRLETYKETNTNLGWYWKPPYPNYAPSGMPDFSQKQDKWKIIFPGPDGVLDSTPSGDDVVSSDGLRIAPGPDCHLDSDPVPDDVTKFNFCGPVAVANCFWWFDSKYANQNGTPGDGKDVFPLVQDYTVGDDHSAANVPKLICKLANEMGTCREGTTYIDDMQDAIDEWFDNTGLDDMFEENTYDAPTFQFIESEIERSQDVILLLGLYDYIPGDKVVDQQQLAWVYWDPIQTATLNDYQSFKPTVDRLDAIQILIVGGPGSVGINVYDSNKTLLGTSTFDPGPLPEKTWVQFHFDPYIPLTPDKVYYFDVWKQNEEDTYEWYFLSYENPANDPYPPGQGWMDTLPNDIYEGNPFDWTFKTEYYDPPPECVREAGHYVTCAGVNSDESKIAFSDSARDIQTPSDDDHNDAQYVSHDIYNVTTGCPCPDLPYKWWLPDFPSGYDYTIVEQAVVICPKPDATPPTVEIAKPKERYLYLFDYEIIPIGLTLIIGPITVEAEAIDNESGMNRVEFYTDDELKHTDNETPYEWKWDETVFFMHTIKAVAYDNAGNHASNEIQVCIFNI